MQTMATVFQASPRNRSGRDKRGRPLARCKGCGNVSIYDPNSGSRKGVAKDGYHVMCRPSKEASTIIQYVNPKKHNGPGGTEWKCVVCNNAYDDYDEARDCAIKDHAAK